MPLSPTGDAGSDIIFPMAKAAEYIRHPELLDSNSVGVLRRLVERYPYYQTARLLLLQNLYQLHDPLYQQELRRSAIMVGDRSVLFNMAEGHNYEIHPTPDQEAAAQPSQAGNEEQQDRTLSLIDAFLESTPDPSARQASTTKAKVPIDATTDYMAYLMQQEDQPELPPTAPSTRQATLSGKLQLQDKEEYETPDEEDAPKEEYFTETLAKIYIKQQKYERALEIIRALSADNPKKNSYFADQIRFLEKLIKINNKRQ